MTYKPKSEFLHVMQARGFLSDCTDMEGLDEALMNGIVPAYIGFDATADSLHVGSLIQIMILRWLQKTGHKPIALMGGGTTKIGDPSGKDKSRQMLDDAAIGENIKGIRKVFDGYLTFGDGPTDAMQVNNADWLDNLNYIEFLRDYGRLFTINRMLTFDSVKLRLEREQPLTFLEFNYMLLQAYDFMELNKRFGCVLQMGGSDQWGNIVNGIDLTRRVNRKTVFGITTPLLTKADGSKMGKSATGAIWLNEDKLSSYEFWQFWRNTLDADVGKFLKLFTELPIAECERLGALEGSDINEAKIILANEVTTLAHGTDAARTAAATAKDVFVDRGKGETLPTIKLSEEDAPESEITVVQLLVKSGLAKSGKDAKRLIKEGSAKLDGVTIGDMLAIYAGKEKSKPYKISVGKKRHINVEMPKISISNLGSRPVKNGKFQVYRDKRGEYRWRRVAANGRIIGASSDGFKNLGDCEFNMNRGAVRDDKWEFYKDVRGEFRWRRSASNGQIIGASPEGFTTEEDAISNARIQGYPNSKK